MKYFEIIGFIGAALMVTTLAMRAMIPLRVVGVVSSIFQIAFAVSAGITPMLIQHGILLPLNAYRLHEQMRLVRKVRSAINKDLSLDCLMPFMTKVRSVRAKSCSTRVIPLARCSWSPLGGCGLARLLSTSYRAAWLGNWDC